MTRILFATSEVFPLVKTGGLADVSASLPEALCRLGHDCHILLPGYPAALKAAKAAGSRRKTRFREGHYDVALWQTRLPGTAVTLWLVDSPALFDRVGDSPYQNEQGEDWWDNAHRFHLFARVAARMALGQLGLSWRPDIVHCNDWQSALIPVFLADSQNPPKTVFTVHNLAYQGLFSHETFQALGLPDTLWHYEFLEFHQQLSFIKGGLVFSDAVTTVSPSYADEIQTPWFGCGLDGLLRHRSARIKGILNGIDTRLWNPADDPYLDAHYGADYPANKALCRASLQQELKLDVCDAPILGFVGRLVEQKGLDWILGVMKPLLEQGCQFALLGSGEHHYEDRLASIAQAWPAQCSLTLGYNEGLAHRITAGADIFLMPSRFEPCGLNQMYSLRYGTVPVVHGVGGLNDTVFDPEEEAPVHANGFVFRDANPDGLLSAINRALTAREHRKTWRKLQHNGMQGDYSWKSRACEYVALYQSLMNSGGRMHDD
ncbi:glycogen synthase GlgA [Marinobacter sp. VGCF2001]|uniref:glycogen synthase GlgA n=1 Tax=Marinobacter sp. VGCF2001 TaxID=3417189 RepID=UPI003CFA8996